MVPGRRRAAGPGPAGRSRSRALCVRLTGSGCALGSFRRRKPGPRSWARLLPAGLSGSAAARVRIPQGHSGLPVSRSRIPGLSGSRVAEPPSPRAPGLRSPDAPGTGAHSAPGRFRSRPRSGSVGCWRCRPGVPELRGVAAVPPSSAARPYVRVRVEPRTCVVPRPGLLHRKPSVATPGPHRARTEPERDSGPYSGLGPTLRPAPARSPLGPHAIPPLTRLAHPARPRVPGPGPGRPLAPEGGTVGAEPAVTHSGHPLSPTRAPD